MPTSGMSQACSNVFVMILILLNPTFRDVSGLCINEGDSLRQGSRSRRDTSNNSASVFVGRWDGIVELFSDLARVGPLRGVGTRITFAKAELMLDLARPDSGVKSGNMLLPFGCSAG